MGPSSLYGSVNASTQNWVDGVFTAAVRASAALFGVPERQHVAPAGAAGGGAGESGNFVEMLVKATREGSLVKMPSVPAGDDQSEVVVGDSQHGAAHPSTVDDQVGAARAFFR